MMQFYHQIPSIDLHGMDREYAIFKVREFIEDCIQMHYHELIIIHGKGQGILQKEVTKYLKNNKYVVEYKLDFMNPGCTIVKLI